MCDYQKRLDGGLSFDQFVEFLQEPPFEPCESELDFLTDSEYLSAFNEKVFLYYPRIIRFIARIVDDRHRAADLTQDVFLRLFKARISLDSSYIYGAAKHAAYNELRHSRRLRALESSWAGIKQRPLRGNALENELPDTRPLPDAAYLERIRREVLERAIERLPEKFRSVLALFAEGRSYRSITEVTHINEGTVKSRICRGKRILRRKLRKYL